MNPSITMTFDPVDAYRAGLIGAEEARKMMGLEGLPPDEDGPDVGPVLLSRPTPASPSITSTDARRLLCPG